jgi:hypothetical protein
MSRNRLKSLERIFVLAEILKASANSVSASYLNRVAGERCGQHNVRTTFRDLRLMERLGQVVHDGRGCWRWVDLKDSKPRAKRRAQ